MKSSLFCGILATLLTHSQMVTAAPMIASAIETVQPVCPAFTRAQDNPVIGFRISVTGTEGSISLEKILLSFAGTSVIDSIASYRIVAGSLIPDLTKIKEVIAGEEFSEKIVLKPNFPLTTGDNWFWLSVRLKDDASLDDHLDASIYGITVAGKNLVPAQASPPGGQRIGCSVRLPGDDGSKSFRIPGLVRTKVGSLIAAYDVRYQHSRDLPADIDVGISRSTDGGQHWEPMRIAMDMGRDPKFGYDGIGDPCILVDPSNGRIWIAALWSHGNRGWHGSGPGLSPDETGQWMMVYSDDDGKTWSQPENHTKELKNPEWKLFFNGPGSGIALKNGTLVFPAQFRAADGKPWSTIVWSDDHGKQWHTGVGVKSDTTEAQVVQLDDGSVMINCRDNRGGARTIAVTSDLGKTWQLHPTDRKALREPVCMASLFAWQRKQGSELWFSNPNATNGRHSMTLKRSLDQGMTWPEKEHLLYDVRPGFGYSCITAVDDQHLGVIYEGNSSLYFLRFKITE